MDFMDHVIGVTSFTFLSSLFIMPIVAVVVMMFKPRHSIQTSSPNPVPTTVTVMKPVIVTQESPTDEDIILSKYDKTLLNDMPVEVREWKRETARANAQMSAQGKEFMKQGKEVY